MLVDTHCHLDFPDYGTEIDMVIARAKNEGVGIMQTISTHISRFDNIKRIAENYTDIYCSVGIHPHHVEEEKKVTPQEIIDHTNHPKVIGIGETGLDYYYENSPRELQRESFINHIEASRKTGIPVIIHTRDAENDTINIIHDEMDKGSFKGLIHCFTGTIELAKKALDYGLYISISGIVTFKKASSLQDIVKQLPLDRLLIETDAPFLAPEPYRGKRNEPAYIKYTAEFIANLKNISVQEVADQTTNNFFDLFTKVRKPL